MINLQDFCHAGRTRTYLTRPFSFGDYTYASNGLIAVRVNRQEDAPENPEAPASIVKLLSEHDGKSFGPLPVFEIQPQRAVRCAECHGRGRYNECAECDGTGQHECSHAGCDDAHDCGDCDGTGADQGGIDEDKPVYTCETCAGKGIKPDDRRLSPAENAVFAVRLWNLAAALPGVEVEHPIHGGTDRPLIFRFIGGYAAIMGMRASPSSIGIIRPAQQTAA